MRPTQRDKSAWRHLLPQAEKLYDQDMLCNARMILGSFLLAASAAAVETFPPDLGSRPNGVDWPDFLGPQRNGRSPETDLHLDWRRSPPEIVWQCKLGVGFAAPSISRGRLFHFDRYGDVNRLTCLQSETGEFLWKVEFATDYVDMLGNNNGPRATPVVDADRVYVQGPEGNLHCVNVVTGERLWQIDTLAQFHVVKNFFGVGSTPLVWNDLLIANIGGSPAGSSGDVFTARGKVRGDGSGVVALDKLTGQVRWQATDELASYSSPIVAPIDDAERLFVLARGGLLALRPEDGKLEFLFPFRARMLNSVNASSPVVVKNEVFVSESYELGGALVRAASDHCEPIWQDAQRGRNQALALQWNTAIYHDGLLYASNGDQSGSAELRCVEWNTGKVRWSEPGLGRTALLYVEGHLICLSEEGRVKLVRATPDRYEPVGQLDLVDAKGEPLLAAPAWTAPVLSHGLLYLRGSDRLVCVDLRDQR